MSDIAEGLGAAVEGALGARALEPTGGADEAGHSEPGTCRNCEAPVSGSYCAKCGQKIHIHRTLSAIGHDLVHGVLHLDGKIWHTLPLLATKPGDLTRRYIEGQRATFVSPMAMFLFSVFAMFAVFQMVGLSVPADIDTDKAIDQIEAAAISLLEQERAELIAELEALDAEAAGAASASTQEANAILREKLQDQIATANAQLATAREDEDSMVEGAEFLFGDGDLDFNLTGFEQFDNGLAEKWQKNPSLMLYKLQANGYKFSWLLIPLSLPVMLILFAWKRRFHAYDHAVFVTYSLSFMSLLFIILSLTNAAGLTAGWVLTIFAILAPLHIYKHLRYAYGLSRFSTLWRFFALMFGILFILLMFLQALLLLGAF